LLFAQPVVQCCRLLLIILRFRSLLFFFFSSRRRHTRSVSAFLLNRSSDLRWIHLSTPLIRLFLLVLILLLMPTLNFLPVWFALSLLRFRLPSRLPMMFILWMVAMLVDIIPSKTVCLLTCFPVRRAIMFMLVSWFGLTLPLLNAADWFR